MSSVSLYMDSRDSYSLVVVVDHASRSERGGTSVEVKSNFQPLGHGRIFHPI
jgi:hypothetical protein